MVGQNNPIIIHINYNSIVERNSILLKYIKPLSELSSCHNWYFSDLEFVIGGKNVYLIEVYLEKNIAASGGNFLIKKWLENIQHDKFISFNFSDNACLLNTGIFPGRLIPYYYLPALCSGSRKAINFLLIDGFKNIKYADFTCIQKEIQYTYDALFQIKDKRIRALNFYRDWLKDVLKKIGKNKIPHTIQSQQINKLALGYPFISKPIPPYRLLLDIFPSNENEFSFSNEKGDQVKEMDILQDIARLCHIQVLRLVGPGHQSEIRDEIVCIENIIGKQL